MPKKATTKKVTKKTVKKVTKKAAPKKTTKKTTKKTASKKSSKQVKALVCAPDDKCFWTTDGQILKDLEELKFAFGSMDDEVFLHHVTKDRNDFADWVENVLEDKACASALRRSKKPSSAKTVVIKHLRLYSA